MVQPLDQQKGEIVALCRRFHVARLDVFGSAATGQFLPGASDFDFLVEFEPLEPGALANAYFGLLQGLSRLLGTKVDLVTPKAIRNPYFRKSVEQTRRLLYAA